MPAATDARRHLTIIARAPRPAGSVAEAEARRHCADVLRAQGFAVADQPIEYSALPGRYATPLLGGTMALAIIAAVALAGRSAGFAALFVLVGSLAVVAALAMWLARHGVLALPLMRERSRNLVATRGKPTVWVLAHLDSKSQPVPIALRAAGLMSLGLVWVAAVGLSIAEVSGMNVAPYWPYFAAAAVAAALPVLFSVVGARSDGARDNASGVATVLSAIERLAKNIPVGVVLTSAEELGLAGARAWARDGAQPGVAINVDTIDDRGDLTVMYSGSHPTALVDVLQKVAANYPTRLVVRRLVPGILTDAVALADAGWQTVTLSRAGMSTLARVHTAADTATGMSAVGINETAALLADALEAFTAQEARA